MTVCDLEKNYIADRLRCADCHSTRLIFSKENKGNTDSVVIHCLSCGRGYPVIDGIPVMLPEIIVSAKLDSMQAQVTEAVQAKVNELTYYGSHINPRPDEYQNLKYGCGWSLSPPKQGTDMYNWYFNRTRRYISDIIIGRDVLKVGCGVGRASEYFAREYKCRVTGLDIALGAVQAAARRSECWSYSDCFVGVCGDMENLPFKDKSFEVGLSEASLHHAVDPCKVISELARVSTKGIVIYNESVASISIRIALRLGFTEEFESGASGNKVWRFKEQDLRRLLKRHGARSIQFHRNWMNTSCKIRWGSFRGRPVRSFTRLLESEFALNLQDCLLGPLGNCLLAVVYF